jgi:copper transport protein
MLGNIHAFLSGEAWSTGAGTSLLISAAVGIAAMTAFALGFTGVRAALWLGVILAVASFLVTGHGVRLEPRWLVDLVFAVHLLGVAFWLGALWPLAVTVKVQEPCAAATVVMRFSRLAAIAVGAIIASGIVVSWIQLQSLTALVHSDYGLRLDAKLALVAVLLAIALHNKRVLTPALAAGRAGAARHLRTWIIVELVLFAAILAAAVALTLVASPNELAG